jgi:hypothetical protein
MMLTDKFLVDEKTQEKRFKVCIPCQYYDKDKNKCMKCGCFLKWKIKFKYSSCPINKW